MIIHGVLWVVNMKHPDKAHAMLLDNLRIISEHRRRSMAIENIRYVDIYVLTITRYLEMCFYVRCTGMFTFTSLSTLKIFNPYLLRMTHWKGVLCGITWYISTGNLDISWHISTGNLDITWYIPTGNLDIWSPVPYCFTL